MSHGGFVPPLGLNNCFTTQQKIGTVNCCEFRKKMKMFFKISDKSCVWVIYIAVTYPLVFSDVISADTAQWNVWGIGT
jgi:hypothetical protein